MKPLVSIIMLSYNNVQFLKSAIISVLNQTYANWELIISDDQSSDGSWELIQKLSEQEPKIKIYQPEENLGIVKNRAFAFAKTTGDLIGHLDGDDELYPYSIETMVGYLKPDIALAQSDNAWMNEQGVVYQYYANKNPNGNLSNAGWRHFGMYWRWAYNDTNGYNTNITNACEDGDLFMQIADKHKYIRVPHVLYKHRWHENNMSHKTKKCDVCTERPLCNYIKVWSKHAGVNPITFKRIDREVV